MNRGRRYRLYIDESGDHTFNLVASDPHRYLGLLGIWFDLDEPYKSFAEGLSRLKAEIFGWHPDDPPVCFHRKDMVGRKGRFGRLREPELNERLEAGLVKLVREARFCMTCVVIDKASCRTNYRELFHPYHHCIAGLLERYAEWLALNGTEGDVMAESRGRNEDQELSQAFQIILREGTRVYSAHRFQQVLTSGEIKLKKKEHAIPGLELADLLAYPCKREMIAELRGEDLARDFSSVLLEAARPKMDCQAPTNRVSGFGKVWLD